MHRYDRQTRLPEIGAEGQQKLLKASVLCVGAGGLGSPALLYLAASGVGRIGIIDFDRVDESNLQRQVLFDTVAIGKPKAQVAANRIKALNPDISVDVLDAELSAENVGTLFLSYDVIIDGTDNFETKFLINDAAVKFGKPWIYGAIQAFDGQASVFNYKGGPCYRCLFPQKPKGRIMNCAEAGVIGAVAGLIGVTQALQTIQIIADHESFEPLSGKLWTLDTKTMQTRILNISQNPDCPVCSQKPDTIALAYSSPVCGFVPELAPQQAHGRNNSCLIDVREQEEWDQGHIDGARLWPLSKMMAGDMPDLPQEMEIILYCQKGMRSLQAAQILKAQGYSEVYSMSGGYEAWLEEC